MSNPDSFIEEVTEEVRRERLFMLMRRYGWIGVLGVALIVGGTAWREISQARAETKAQAFGDAVLAALALEDESARADALMSIEADGADATALLTLLAAGEEQSPEAAVERLQAISGAADGTLFYQQLAAYKALVQAGEVLPLDERKAGFEALAIPGQPLRLLAEEQLALIEIEANDADAALERLIGLRDDAEVSAGLRRRAEQLILALGGESEAD